ncbi:yippee zinc-binding/DNA-binding /Mis18, centromere assembly-domain-containing protein [Ochromonadaceae sp. CCMP2298]|nr:yippee zinc-binding/DNA-binding /Mis18, centromere assembly-domain-containing protein [Ochromonadaceae sp. CCMP2298]|mmetsp:Transcript_1928/g.4480  ORF Transcript_1928/g.4480 Transcript_1928/m.4480 type:complete len:193 (-) Transcript_1928:1583-2161(-)
MQDSTVGDGLGEGEDPEVSGPLVFSCAQCKTIVGDSFSFLSSNEEAKTVTISAASSIQRSTELYTSYASLDEGSTYFCFMCSQCQNMLGRYYVTTSVDLDHVREKFTFNIDSITSYELGKAQHGKMPEPEVSMGEQAKTEDKQGGPALECVQEDVDKIQHVLVDLVGRVGQLEAELRALKGPAHHKRPRNAS